MADEDERESTGAEIVDELETLEASVSSEEERRMAERIRRFGEALYGLEQRAIGDVGERIRTYTTRDVAEAFVGSTLFSLSLVVEDGVFETSEHSATSLVFGLPVYFLGNLVFVTVVTAGLLYSAEFRRVEATDVLGAVPRRLAAVLVTAFVTAAATMALWGRLDPRGRSSRSVRCR